MNVSVIKKFAEYFERLYIDFVRYTIENFDFYNDSINFDKLLQNAEKIESVVGIGAKGIENFIIRPILDNKSTYLLKFVDDIFSFNVGHCYNNIIIHPNDYNYQNLPFVIIESLHIPKGYFTLSTNIKNLHICIRAEKKIRNRITILYETVCIPLKQRFFSIHNNDDKITLLIHAKNHLIFNTKEDDINSTYISKDFNVELNYRYAPSLKQIKLQNKFSYRYKKPKVVYKIGFNPITKIGELESLVKTIIETYKSSFPIYYDAAVYPNGLSPDDQVIVTIVGKTKTGSHFVFDLLLQE